MTRLIFQIIGGVIAFWLADRFVPGVEFVEPFWQTLLLAGLVLGLINFFIKPILKLITLPLRILTLGFFGLIINMAIIWAVDVLFPELIIQGIIPLFWTTLIVWIINFLLGNSIPRKRSRCLFG